MKKLLNLMLALALIFSVAPAFADDDTGDDNNTSVVEATVTIEDGESCSADEDIDNDDCYEDDDMDDDDDDDMDDDSSTFEERLNDCLDEGNTHQECIKKFKEDLSKRKKIRFQVDKRYHSVKLKNLLKDRAKKNGQILKNCIKDGGTIDECRDELAEKREEIIAEIREENPELADIMQEILDISESLRDLNTQLREALTEVRGLMEDEVKEQLRGNAKEDISNFRDCIKGGETIDECLDALHESKMDYIDEISGENPELATAMEKVANIKEEIYLLGQELRTALKEKRDIQKASE